MIRTRDNAGRVEEVKGGCFVEVLNNDGLLGCVVYRDPSGSIHVITKEDAEAARYSRLFNVEFAPIVELPKPKIVESRS